MSFENFVYWLQEFIEIGNPSSLNTVQTQTIKNHLKLVLTVVTPVLDSSPAEEKFSALQITPKKTTEPTYC